MVRYLCMNGWMWLKVLWVVEKTKRIIYYFYYFIYYLLFIYLLFIYYFYYYYFLFSNNKSVSRFDEQKTLVILSVCSCKLTKLLFWSDGCFAWRRTWNWNDFEQLAELLLDTYITVNPVRSGWPPLTVSISHFKTCTHRCCTPCHVVHNSLLWARIKLLLWVEITWNCLQDFFTLFPWRSQCCVVPVPTASPPQRPVSEQLASRRPDWLPWW